MDPQPAWLARWQQQPEDEVRYAPECLETVEAVLRVEDAARVAWQQARADAGGRLATVVLGVVRDLKGEGRDPTTCVVRVSPRGYAALQRWGAQQAPVWTGAPPRMAWGTSAHCVLYGIRVEPDPQVATWTVVPQAAKGTG